MAAKERFVKLAKANAAGTIERQPVTDSEGCFPKVPLWGQICHGLREPLSEFFGTLILILFGDGVVAQVTLSQNQRGDYQSISWGWGCVASFRSSSRGEQTVN